ncbi:MAG: DUF1772 domain-containing protein [Edaphobacter sp.]|nr:DUF1772 domain-containing protein [Edaphobacter sp.]MDE1176429.1 DUF1772 domain-containing protein [Edaphobacter sp.]
MATVLWAATIAYSVLLLVPINNRIADRGEGTPLSARLDEHRRWDRMHRLRIFFLLLAMLLATHTLLRA